MHTTQSSTFNLSRMIRAIAIDDEINALGIIREFSSRIADLNLVDSFTDPLKALSFLEENDDIDLVFLDIQMARLNGLMVASRLPEGVQAILTTAYPDYALQGYELSVADYLLKPFSFSRFEKAVRKVASTQKIAPSVTSSPASAAGSGKALEDIILVKTDYKTIKLRVSDIKYIEGARNYVTLHTSQGKVLTLQNMKNFEEQLQPYGFVRIHKSFIVAFSHVDAFEKNQLWIGDRAIPVGESYRDSFQQFINQRYRQF